MSGKKSTKLRSNGRARRRESATLIFQGTDSELGALSEIDPVFSMSYVEKLTAIYELTLFEHQVRNETDDLPRFLRTTACIRKA